MHFHKSTIFLIAIMIASTATRILLRGRGGVSAFSPLVLSSSSFSTTATAKSSEPRLYRRKKRTALRLAKDGSTTKVREELYRADRVLSNRCSDLSRSECFTLLKERRVFSVDDDENEEQENQQQQKRHNHRSLKVVPGPSTKLSMNTQLYIDKTELVPMPPPLLRMYHKPKWVLSVRKDPHGRPCLNDRSLPKELTTSSNMHPVGRLDYDTSGLLLFSSSGTLTQILLHPKHSISKEYEAVVVGGKVDDGDERSNSGGSLDVDKLGAQLESGVTTGEGVHTATLLDAVRMDQSLVSSYLKQIRQSLPQEYNRTDLALRGYLKDISDDTQQLWTVRLEVSEGKHRMVRRMLANCGHGVISLYRKRFGDVVLDPNQTPVGTYRDLTPSELSWAESLLPKNNKKKKGNNRKRRK